MDRYINKKKTTERVDNLNDHFHLIGLTCVWISSKLEDVREISIDQIIRDAGHSKFRK